MLNIKPVHGETYSCSEDIIYALCCWWNREYILKFTETWSFSYISSEASKKNLFGDRINANRGKGYGFLEKYHGIKTIEHEFKNLEDIMRVVKEQLNIGQPVSLNLDLFNCSWSPAYQIHHCEHYCIIVGFDESEDVLYCTDPFLNKSLVPLTLSDLTMGCTMYLTYEFLPLSSIVVDWKEIISNACSRVDKDPVYNMNIFDMMNSFARDMRCEMDLKLEIDGYKDMVFVPLFTQMLRISWARLNFSEVLIYLSNKCKVQDLLTFSDEFKQCAHEWNVVRGLLIRESIMLSGKAEVMKNIECKIYMIAEKEKELSQRLYKISK